MQPSDLQIHLPDLEQAIERRILNVTTDMAVPTVIEQMSQNRMSCAFVVEADQLVGIITERDIVRLTAAGANLSEIEIADVMTQNVATLIQSDSANLSTALTLFKQQRIRHLPVADPQGRVVGVVTPTSIRQALHPNNLLKWQRVGDAMTTRVIHAPLTATVLSLAQLMAERRVSCVVIVEGGTGDWKSDTLQPLTPVGIVTERDIVQYHTLGLDLAQTQANTVMSAPLIPAHPENSLWEVHQEMQRRHIRRLVITGDGGELAGILTQTNLLRALDITEMYSAVGVLQHLVEQRTAELSQINQSLRNEIAERQQVETMLRRTQSDIEQRVKHRTAELSVANQQLAQEIQERRQAEIALQENYSLLRAIIDATPGAVFFKDVQGHYQLINRAGAQLFNKSIEEMIGLTDLDLFPADVAAQIAVDDQKLLASNQSATFEETVTIQGELRHYLTTKTVHHDSLGNPLGVVGFAREITQLKQIQQTLSQVNQNLEQANKQLEHQVWERTAALRGMNQQLIQEIAERRSIQESLDQKNAEFEAILKAIPDALVFADVDRHMRLLNPAFTRMFGYSADEVRGSHTRVLYANVEDYEAQGRIRFNLNAEDRLKPYEVNYRRRHGDVFVSETVGTAVKDNNGQTLGFLGIIRDISDRKRTEAALVESQERYALAVQGSGAGLWDWNILTNEVYYSPRFKQILGYDDHEMAHHLSSFESLLHPDDHDWVCEQVNTHFRRRTPYEAEYRLRTKNGDYRWIYARGQAIWDDAGNPTRMAGSVSDISDRKRTEAALQESQERYALAVRGAGDGLWDWNILTNDLYLSPRFKQIMGYEDPELPNEFDAWESQLHPADRERVHGAVENHLNHQVPYDLEYRIRTKSGNYRWVRTRAQAIWDEGGNPTRMVGSISDISDRKRVEEELRQYQDRLEQMVESRTAELTQANQRLQQEITERQQIESSLKYQAELEKLISDISNQFINLNPEAVDQGIETALEALSEFMQADRGHVILRPNQSKTSQCIYAWCAPGVKPTQQDLNAGLLGADAPWLDQQLQQFGVARIASIADLPPEASAEKVLCQGDGIQSLVAVRIVYANSLLGLLSIESVRTETHWSERDITRLRIVAEIFASALEHRRSQDALVDRTRDLERSNADLEQFAYVASHDLQEPLRAVTSYGQLLSKRYDGQLDARANKYIGYIVDGGNRMQQLIQDLLNYSRVGKRVRTVQPIAGDQVLEKVLDNLAFAVTQATATITCAPLPQVMADEGQLIQLLQNLISNAIKFKGEDPPKIHISAIRFQERKWRTPRSASHY